jgi:hypothetical protein
VPTVEVAACTVFGVFVGGLGRLEEVCTHQVCVSMRERAAQCADWNREARRRTEGRLTNRNKRPTATVNLDIVAMGRLPTILQKRGTCIAEGIPHEEALRISHSK